MDWSIIISAFMGLTTGGSISWLFKLKEDKARSQADAIDKAADAMKKLLDNVGQQQDVFNKIIDKKDQFIFEQASEIEKLQRKINASSFESSRRKEKLWP